MKNKTYHTCHKVNHNKSNNKITELRTILQRESQNISGERTTFGVKRSLITYIRGTDNIWCQKVTHNIYHGNGQHLVLKGHS